jgi:PEP-CTERM motif
METKKRTRRKPRLIKRVLLIGVTLSCLFAVILFAQHVWMLYHAEELLLTAPVPNFRAAREIYPYSVVPGGVFDSKDVADTIAHDPVARAHYAGIHAERLWAERINEPMLAYVSYRKDDSVRWTAQPVRIAKGEIILTDGTNRIRGRCGNRIEIKKPTPLPATVSVPEVPPPDIVFETPLPPLIPPIIVRPLPPMCVGCIPPPPTPPPPPVPPMCVGCIPPPPTPPPPPVPEPGTLLLVGTGLALLGKFGIRKRR